MIGELNEASLIIEGIECVGLIDTSSMVSTISKDFYTIYLSTLTMHPVDDILKI